MKHLRTIAFSWGPIVLQRLASSWGKPAASEGNQSNWMLHSSRPSSSSANKNRSRSISRGSSRSRSSTSRAEVEVMRVVVVVVVVVLICPCSVDALLPSLFACLLFPFLPCLIPWLLACLLPCFLPSFLDWLLPCLLCFVCCESWKTKNMETWRNLKQKSKKFYSFAEINPAGCFCFRVIQTQTLSKSSLRINRSFFDPFSSKGRGDHGSAGRWRWTLPGLLQANPSPLERSHQHPIKMRLPKTKKWNSTTSYVHGIPMINVIKPTNDMYTTLRFFEGMPSTPL